MRMSQELDRATMRSLGGVLARGLMKRVEGRSESIPAGHALAIVISAAAKVQAAHAAGRRLYATADTVLIRFDGTVEIRGSRWPQGSDPRADVRALGRFLVELLTSDELTGDVMASIAAAIDPNRGAASAEELARTLVQIARDAELTLTQQLLGRWARHQVYPRSTDTPVAGVEVRGGGGEVREVSDSAETSRARIARGSGEFQHEHDESQPIDVRELDFDKIMQDAVEVAAPVAIDTRPRALRAPSVSPVALPAASGTLTRADRSFGTAIVKVIAVLMILGAAGFALYAAYPDVVDRAVGALFR